MRKTEAKPGKAAVMKLREDEEQLVIDWINKQSVYADSMRYLIQKEIAKNGIRDLQSFVPRIRDIESIRQQLTQEKAAGESMSPISASTQPVEKFVNQSSEVTNVIEQKPSDFEVSRDIESSIGTNSVQTDIIKSQDVSKESINDSIENVYVAQQVEQTSNDSRKRHAGKKFDSSVVGSFQ